jgi:hypothetical protein
MNPFSVYDAVKPFHQHQRHVVIIVLTVLLLFMWMEIFHEIEIQTVMVS